MCFNALDLNQYAFLMNFVQFFLVTVHKSARTRLDSKSFESDEKVSLQVVEKI